MSKLTLDEIKQGIEERHTKAIPRGRDVKKMEKPYTCREVVFTCSNGWAIERLSEDDFPVEGFFMGHCLGGPDSGGCIANFSLREPDGTPHVTIVNRSGRARTGFGNVSLAGRCNAYPKAKYVALINEWQEAEGMPLFPPSANVKWGTDTDEQYHESGILDDRDYRDAKAGALWRDSAWEEKRNA